MVLNAPVSFSKAQNQRRMTSFSTLTFACDICPLSIPEGRVRPLVRALKLRVLPELGGKREQCCLSQEST